MISNPFRMLEKKDYNKKYPIQTIVFFGIAVLCLIGSTTRIRFYSPAAVILNDVTSLLNDASIHLFIILCFITNIFTLAALQWRVAKPECLVSYPDFWLILALILGSVCFIFSSSQVTDTTHCVILLSCIAIGKGASLWVAVGDCGEEVEFRASVLIFTLLIIFFAIGFVPAKHFESHYFYRGIPRWSGVWDNPNTFGMLMAVGLVMSVGQVGKSVFKHGSTRIAGDKVGTIRLGQALIFLLPLIAGACFITGLLHSYSRGAWVGGMAGLIYLCSCRSNRLWMRLKIKYGKCLIQFGILVVSVVVIILQVVHYTNSQSPLLKRALSFINLNDFSWRNRIMSWESSASMIGDHLCQNTGWHQSPLIQSEYYIPIGSAETPDLNLNSYLLIGCVFGLLVLCAWIYYLRLVLWRKPNHGNTQLAVLPTNFIYESEAQFICRAGATVLLVSMWFEGGLFTVPIAFIFWTLVEVGRRDLWKTAILKTTSRSQSEVSDSE